MEDRNEIKIKEITDKHCICIDFIDEEKAYRDVDGAVEEMQLHFDNSEMTLEEYKENHDVKEIKVCGKEYFEITELPLGEFEDWDAFEIENTKGYDELMKAIDIFNEKQKNGCYLASYCVGYVDLFGFIESEETHKEETNG